MTRKPICLCRLASLAGCALLFSLPAPAEEIGGGSQIYGFEKPLIEKAQERLALVNRWRKVKHFLPFVLMQHESYKMTAEKAFGFEASVDASLNTMLEGGHAPAPGSNNFEKTVATLEAIASALPEESQLTVEAAYLKIRLMLQGADDEVVATAPGRRVAGGYALDLFGGDLGEDFLDRLESARAGLARED